MCLGILLTTCMEKFCPSVFLDQNLFILSCLKRRRRWWSKQYRHFSRQCSRQLSYRSSWIIDGLHSMIASVISFIIKIGTSKRVAWRQYIQSNFLSIYGRLYYLMKQLISVTELKEYDDDIKTKTSKPFRLRTSKHMLKNTGTTQQTPSPHKNIIHNQLPNPYSPPSLKVHVYSRSPSSSSTLPHYLLHGPRFLPSSFNPPTNILPTHLLHLSQMQTWFQFGTLCSTPLRLEYMVAQLEEVSGPWSMTSNVWKGEQMAKDLLKGRKVSQGGRFTCIDKIAFRRTIAKYSVSRFLNFWSTSSWVWAPMKDVWSQVTDEGAEDNDADELGEEIEVSHSNCIV